MHRGCYLLLVNANLQPIAQTLLLLIGGNHRRMVSKRSPRGRAVWGDGGAYMPEKPPGQGLRSLIGRWRADRYATRPTVTATRS